MAINKTDATTAATPRASLTREPYLSYAENNTPAKSAEEILQALRSNPASTEVIRRPVLRDDQLAGTSPENMTVEEAKRLSEMQHRKSAKSGGPTVR